MKSTIDLSKFDDLVMQLQVASDKAKCIMGDMTEEYFSYDDMAPGTEHVCELIYNYKDYSTKARIVFDYILNLQQIIGELQEMNDRAFEEARKLNAAV